MCPPPPPSSDAPPDGPSGRDSGARPHAGPSSRERRAPGLVLLVGIVVLGLAAGAGYYRYQQPRVKAETEARLRAAPRTAEGQLDLWMEYARPILIERLRAARISQQQPWIVTHVVEDAAGGAPQVWGIESDAVGPESVRAEGLTAVVELPAPRALARTVLVGDHARAVLRVPPGGAIPDASARLVEIAEFALRYQRQKLEEDIEGASLVVDVSEHGST